MVPQPGKSYIRHSDGGRTGCKERCSKIGNVVALGNDSWNSIFAPENTTQSSEESNNCFCEQLTTNGRNGLLVCCRWRGLNAEGDGSTVRIDVGRMDLSTVDDANAIP